MSQRDLFARGFGSMGGDDGAFEGNIGGLVVPNETAVGVELADAKEETDVLEFKGQFDPNQPADWCELIKDIVAMANSGGGRIVIGANDDGSPSGYDAGPFLAIDAADITNKIHKYTALQFSDFQVLAGTMHGSPVAVLSIGGVRFPVVFSSPGDYEFPLGKPKCAFRKGTVYFRHGAKSEPGSTEDLRSALERELARVKDFWLAGISKVVEAPPGSEIRVVQTAVSLVPSNEAQQIRLTNSGEGPEFRVVDNDQLYPYRQKELMKKLDETIGSKAATTHDIRLVRQHHGIDENPNFSHKSRFGTRQYSQAFVDWLASEYGRDGQFFQKAKEACRARSEQKDGVQRKPEI